MICMQYKYHSVGTVNIKMNMVLYTKRFTCILGIYILFEISYSFRSTSCQYVHNYFVIYLTNESDLM